MKKLIAEWSIYLQHVDNIHKKTLYIDASVYLMNREDSIDIDSELDFIICEQILSNKEKDNDRKEYPGLTETCIVFQQRRINRL